jgi:hypothetical protein
VRIIRVRAITLDQIGGRRARGAVHPPIIGVCRARVLRWGFAVFTLISVTVQTFASGTDLIGVASTRRILGFDLRPCRADRLSLGLASALRLKPL